MSDKQNTIFGIYPVQEAITSDIVIDKLFVQKDSLNQKIEAIIQQLEKSDTTINYVPIEKLNRLTKGNHQGVVALSSPISFYALEEIVENVIKKER